VATRQSVAAVGGTVIYAMALQGVAVIHAISGVDPYLLTNQLTAWHALFESPFHIGPILRAIWVSVAFALPPGVRATVQKGFRFRFRKRRLRSAQDDAKGPAVAVTVQVARDRHVDGQAFAVVRQIHREPRAYPPDRLP